MVTRTILTTFLILLLGAHPVFAINRSDFAISPEELNAEGVVVLGWKDGNHKILFAKNPDTLYPLASITKLVTAIAVLSSYKESEIFTVSEEAVNTVGSMGGLSTGDKLYRDELLKDMLVESSNDASMVFAEHMDEGILINKMNTYLEFMNYNHTNFTSPSGLDPLNKKIEPNSLSPFSTALLTNKVYQEKPLIKEMLSYKKLPVFDYSGKKIKELTHTNRLLFDEKYSSYILMSKTGNTKQASQTLTLISKGLKEFDYFTVVILASKDAKSDAKKILNLLYDIEKVDIVNKTGF